MELSLRDFIFYYQKNNINFIQQLPTNYINFINNELKKCKKVRTRLMFIIDKDGLHYIGKNNCIRLNTNEFFSNSIKFDKKKYSNILYIKYILDYKFYGQINNDIKLKTIPKYNYSNYENQLIQNKSIILKKRTKIIDIFKYIEDNINFYYFSSPVEYNKVFEYFSKIMRNIKPLQLKKYKLNYESIEDIPKNYPEIIVLNCSVIKINGIINLLWNYKCNYYNYIKLKKRHRSMIGNKNFNLVSSNSNLFRLLESKYVYSGGPRKRPVWASEKMRSFYPGRDKNRNHKKKYYMDGEDKIYIKSLKPHKNLLRYKKKYRKKY